MACNAHIEDCDDFPAGFNNVTCEDGPDADAAEQRSVKVSENDISLGRLGAITAVRKRQGHGGGE